jgi:hypothetical protein
MDSAWDFINGYEGSPPRGWWAEMANDESFYDFAEREMSYEDAMAQGEEIATDEGGWGAWMGGEL